MPPRSVKMKRFIFGFQRRVWCPKWTPASRSSFMETTGMSAPFSVSVVFRRRRLDGDREQRRPPSTYPSAGLKFWTPEWYRLAEFVQVGLELGRERRAHIEPLAAERVWEGKPRGVQELPAELGLRYAVDGVADDGELDRGEVDADLVHAARLQPDAQKSALGPQP